MACSCLTKAVRLLQQRHIIQIPRFGKQPEHVRGYSVSSICFRKDDNILSVHISPDGDWWLGTEIYAAKHNPSNYVRSIKLPENFDENNHLLGSLPESSFTLMYDTGLLDSSLLSPVPISTKSTPSCHPDSESLNHNR